jgi:hypothetical protein
VVVDWKDNGFVCIALRQGIPVFIRQKMRRAAGSDGRADLLATLQYYDDQHPHSAQTMESEPVPVYLVGEVPKEMAEAAASSGPGGFDACMPVSHAAWRVQMSRPELNHQAIHSPVPALSASGLSALASMVTA